MNVVFISPHFPPNVRYFCAALRACGASVLGIGDVPPQAVPAEVQRALTDYIFVPDMSSYNDMLRAVALLVYRHGRIDAIDSNNEHWLDVEARLREDFNIPGLRPRETQRYRSKFGMAEVLSSHGVAGPPGVLVRSRKHIEDFVRTHGLPVFLKPDIGVGAEKVIHVKTQEQLAPLLENPPVGFLLQRYIDGRITTFDGLTDHDGNIVFRSSFVYADPIADIVRENRDVFFYTRRELPPALDALGTRVVKAFQLRARFFHAEFFELPDGSFLPLEINLRPPGGYSTDLMNYACDVDLYQLWARVVTFDDVSDFQYQFRYHAGLVGRRERNYRIPHNEVPRHAGAALVAIPDVPMGLRVMGYPQYLLRHEDEAALVSLATSLR